MKSAALLFAWAIATPILSAAEWIKVSTANFDLYTTATEPEARQTLETFEQTRDFFLRVKPATVTSQLPVTLVRFADAKEYKQYSPKDFALAYFASDEQRDYIVLSDLGADQTRAAIHEYVHLLVRHSGLTLPLWLNEGLADVYSTMEVRDGRIVVGASPKDRVYSLTHDSWMRLPALFTVAANSLQYNEQNRAGIFYAQSWLLVHMLMLQDGYAYNFSNFVQRVSASGSAQTAFADVYHTTLAEIQTGMNAYLRQSSIGAESFQSTLQIGEIRPARRATELEVGLTLAKLTALVGRYDDVVERLERLSAIHPANAEIDEAQAYLALRKGDLPVALEHLRSALDHGSSNWKTSWDYARLLDPRADERQLRVQALRKALEAKPDLKEARLMLGSELNVMGDYTGAIAELQQVKDVDPEYGARMFLTMAYAAAALRHEDEAKEYAREARKYPLRPEDTARLEALLRNPDSVAVRDPETDAVPDRPVLRRGKQGPRGKQ